MATKQRLVHDIENKSTLLTGKTTTLGSKLMPTRRPALGDRTNQEVTKQNIVKQALKKTELTTQQTEKPKLNIAPKPTQNALKPTTKINKTKEETKDEKVHPVLEKKPEILKTQAYSTQHFGLIQEDDTDPLLVPYYVNDIVAYIQTLELEFMVNSFFLERHRTTARMRSILVNWLVEVHTNFKLVQESLYLSISIVDRYLQKNKTIGRDTLQLVGIVALYIAAKYEDIYPPDVNDLVYVCDDVFRKADIFEMERSVIKTLGFKFGSPSSLHFLRRYSKVGKVEANHHNLAKYLIESTLIDHQYSSVRPSLIATAAICLSIRLLSPEGANLTSIKTIEHVSGFKQKDIAPVIKNLAKTILKSQASKYQAIRNKYANASHCFISMRTELKNGLITKLAGV